MRASGRSLPSECDAGLGDRERPLDVGGLADIVGERYAAEPLTFGSNAGVLGEQATRKPCHRERADLEEHDVGSVGRQRRSIIACRKYRPTL